MFLTKGGFMEEQLQKKIRGKRGQISVPVSIRKQTEATPEKKQVIRGTTADLSNSGLGVYTEGELQTGTLIEIECPDIWAVPKKFTVIWCHKVRLNFYRMGLAIQN
jgi:hypothetical protein